MLPDTYSAFQADFAIWSEFPSVTTGYLAKLSK